MVTYSFAALPTYLEKEKKIGNKIFILFAALLSQITFSMYAFHIELLLQLLFLYLLERIVNLDCGKHKSIAEWRNRKEFCRVILRRSKGTRS